jgi:hypothetical protein
MNAAFLKDHKELSGGTISKWVSKSITGGISVNTIKVRSQAKRRNPIMAAPVILCLQGATAVLDIIPNRIDLEAVEGAEDTG